VPFISEVLDDNFVVTVIDLRTMEVLINENVKKLKSRFQTGTKTTIDNGGFEKVKRTKKQLISSTPIQVFGVPAKGVVTPVFGDQGEVVAIIIVAKSMELETNIEAIADSVFSSMYQLNTGIEEVSSRSQELSIFINEILKFSEQNINRINEIDNVIESIMTISSQSNFLALNAKIEAARARDSEKGFNVVAQEMSKLSRVSKDAAEKASESLGDMKSAMDIITKQIREISQSSESHAAATEEIEAITKEIVRLTKKLSNMVKVKSFEEMINED